jgi:predicted DNA-binding antitoxin AbrB/MazE fold protein
VIVNRFFRRGQIILGIRIEERRENKQRKPLKDICLGEGEEVDIEKARKSVDAFHGKMKIQKKMADEIIENEMWD